MSNGNRSRDVEKEYSDAETIRKLERLVDCMKTGKPFEIQVAGERIYVPLRARFTIEHEVGEGEEELEFQFRWSRTE
ncbi:MAG: amphi-Trp domain-containing protein [Pseudomonadota bacterium]